MEIANCYVTKEIKIHIYGMRLDYILKQESFRKCLRVAIFLNGCYGLKSKARFTLARIFVVGKTRN